MATVHLAIDGTDGRQVAVKLPNPALAASIGSERFLREIEQGQRLHHDRIVGGLAWGKSAAQL
jgi:hypothetical protein